MPQTIRSKTPEYRRTYEFYREVYDYRALVDGTITRRKLEALQAIGYPLSHLGARMGRCQQSMSKTMHRGTAIHMATVKAVNRLYDELHDTHPKGYTANRARLRAQRLGYAAPACWDDIQNPKEEPKGVVRV